MESYEQFCSRTVNALLPAACSTSPRPQRALSTIHFHGRRLLQPVVSEAQRVQMAADRQTAVERDRRRQTRQTDALLERVQHILNNIQVHKEPDSAVTPTSDSSLTLGSKMSVRPWTTPAPKLTLSPSSSLKRETLRLLNQRMEKLASDEFSDPESPDSSLTGLCLSLTGSYAQLPSPQRSRSPRPQATASAGNILISSPVSECELSTAGSETHPSGITNEQRSALTASLLPSPGGEWNCSGLELSDRQLSIITSTPTSTRLDPETQDVSCEKPRMARRRSTSTVLNRSYDVENPSPSLKRPQVYSDHPIRHQLEAERHSQQLLEDQMNIKQLSATDNSGVEQQILALEMLRKHFEKEHAHQISELLMAQERQTQHLQQEACVDQMKALCRLTAVARGFLTRRLLQTDKITYLRKTIQDSRDFIRSFQTDSQLKRVSVSQQDLSLYQRVTAQLRLALHDVHQIFIVWPVRDRLTLLQHDRDIRRERTLRDMDKDSPGNTRILSSATQKTLDRKAQRQEKKSKVIPKSSSARSAVKKRDECLGVRQQRALHRKYLSLG
ncbi:hypothetical protein Q8A67_020114 [Cirrhinus molitorella]|uniref:Centriolar coiled-coil protein of 110 kDa-like n=1 Tax=Cirrhinus molitorella TaxID=172907 RepID=A0AA88TCJ9_9TELE|nr:hypothetical protein Q8A67_020114 [Cirrhinus molitorella]